MRIWRLCNIISPIIHAIKPEKASGLPAGWHIDSIGPIIRTRNGMSARMTAFLARTGITTIGTGPAPINAFTHPCEWIWPASAGLNPAHRPEVSAPVRFAVSVSAVPSMAKRCFPGRSGDLRPGRIVSLGRRRKRGLPGRNCESGPGAAEIPAPKDTPCGTDAVFLAITLSGLRLPGRIVFLGRCGQDHHGGAIAKNRTEGM